MSDRTADVVGALIGVALGGIITLYGLRAAVDYVIARAAKDA